MVTGRPGKPVCGWLEIDLPRQFECARKSEEEGRRLKVSSNEVRRSVKICILNFASEDWTVAEVERHAIPSLPTGTGNVIHSGRDNRLGPNVLSRAAVVAVDQMGNCLQPVDPLGASIPRDTSTDVSPVKKSSLPIIFVIGGPGAGKRTQSNKIAERYSFLYINGNDILREEVSRQSGKGIIIAKIMTEGKPIPADVLVELIKLKMLANLEKTDGFLFSGFPRTKEQAILFEKDVRSPDLILYLSVRESLLRDRVMARTITTTQRREYIEDDVKERIRLFYKSNLPILRHFKKKLTIIDGEQDVPEVFTDLCNVIDGVTSNKMSMTKMPSPTATVLANARNKISNRTLY